MTIEITLGNAIAICAMFVAALFALVKIIGAQQEKRLAEKFDALGAQLKSLGAEIRKEAEATRALEQAFHKSQLDLALNYVRRDDFLQALGGLNTRLDNFALRVERSMTTLEKLYETR